MLHGIYVDCRRGVGFSCPSAVTYYQLHEEKMPSCHKIKP